MRSAEPRGGGENDGSADVLVCHIVDYPQGLIYSLFFNPFFKWINVFLLSQVSKKQTTKQTRLLLSFAGQWAAVTFMKMAPVISNKAQGALAQSISIIYPEQNTVSSHCG